MQASYFIPLERLSNFMKDGAMNNQYGIQLFCTAEPEAAARVLPPPLELADPRSPMLFAYIVNIRNPTFAPWYMEGGVGLMVRYGEIVGVYFLGLMLSGPGALMGACSGREASGLPKKLCERIVVERMGDWGHCLIQRNGVRLLDVTVRMGNYNDPNMSVPQEKATPERPMTTEGGCLIHKYQFSAASFANMTLMHYNSPTRFYSWEPAEAEVKLGSSLDDPWAEVPIKSVQGAGWMVSDNWVRSLTPLHEYPQEQTNQIMQYLFSGRWDQCVLHREHQYYE